MRDFPIIGLCVLECGNSSRVTQTKSAFKASRLRRKYERGKEKSSNDANTSPSTNVVTIPGFFRCLTPLRGKIQNLEMLCLTKTWNIVGAEFWKLYSLMQFPSAQSSWGSPFSLSLLPSWSGSSSSSAAPPCQPLHGTGGHVSQCSPLKPGTEDNSGGNSCGMSQNLFLSQKTLLDIKYF